MLDENKTLDIISADKVEVKEVKWLWPGYIPYGKITLLQGDPGDGKSTFMLTIAALLTTGQSLPFCDEEIEPMNVIYQTTEDDAQDTVVPRFIKAGGDTTKLHFINEKEKTLTFSDRRIADAIKATNAKLVILDPLSAYIGGDVSLNIANDVRAQFNPLIQAAKETGCAVVIVGHMNKMGGTKALYRSLGSIDVVGAARSCLLIARTDKDRPDERVMAVQKSNLAATGNAVIFNITQGGIEWVEETARTADEILSSSFSSSGRPNEQITKAKEILLEMLTDGPRAQTDIMSRMEKERIGKSTAIKAKSELGCVSTKEGKRWQWSLVSEECTKEDDIAECY